MKNVAMVLGLLGCSSGAGQRSVTEPSSSAAETASVAGSAAASGDGELEAPSARGTSFELDQMTLKLPARVEFDEGTDRITFASGIALHHVLDYLAAKPAITVLRIEGHMDDRAGDTQGLSKQRAMAVASWLVSKGVDCKRVLPVGFGGTKPIRANDGAENRAMNQRVEFVNAELRGRPIGGMPLDGSGEVAGDACQ
jgi:OOP family OmpA-OmpF porin